MEKRVIRINCFLLTFVLMFCLVQVIMPHVSLQCYNCSQCKELGTGKIPRVHVPIFKNVVQGTKAFILSLHGPSSVCCSYGLHMNNLMSMLFDAIPGPWIPIPDSWVPVPDLGDVALMLKNHVSTSHYSVLGSKDLILVFLTRCRVFVKLNKRQGSRIGLLPIRYRIAKTRHRVFII